MLVKKKKAEYYRKYKLECFRDLVFCYVFSLYILTKNKLFVISFINK